MLHGHLVRSSWPLARLRPAAASAEARTLTLCAGPDIVAAAEADLMALPGCELKDGRRYCSAQTAAGLAGWFQGIGTFVIDGPRRRVVAPAPVDTADWEHFAVGWALPSVLGEVDATVLHGCAVAGRDRAWILCAASGSGKTTTSLALRAAGMHLLSDDVAVIEAGTPTVAAGPRGSRVVGADGTKALHFDEAAPPTAPIPLAGLAVLRPRGASWLHRRLAPADAFISLLPHACPASDAARDRMTRHLAQLARGLPVLEISVPEGLAALTGAAGELVEVLTR